MDVWRYILKNDNSVTNFHFEVEADILRDDEMELLSKMRPGLCQLEIGVQTTNPMTLKEIRRNMDMEKLRKTVETILSYETVHVHLDLIAGLPYEDYVTFSKTFNDVVSLRPKELQLGFLKLLHGTRLKNEASKYNYVWMENAPYEVISNDFLSIEDIKEIHITEDAFEKYYNSGYMSESMNIILDNETNPFNFFHDLGKVMINIKGLENLFKTIDDFLINKPYYKEVHKTLIIDYLKYFNLRPKAWWNQAMDKSLKNNVLRDLVESNKLEEDLLDLYKYSLLVELEDCWIIAIYKPNNKKIISISKE